MKSTLSLYLILLVAGLGLAGYLVCLADWLQDFGSGYYRAHHLEAWLESGFLVAYTGLGVRFGLRHVNLRL